MIADSFVTQVDLGAVGTFIADFEGVAGVEGAKSGQFSVCDRLGCFQGAISTVEREGSELIRRGSPSLNT